MPIHKFDTQRRTWQPFGALAALGILAFGVWNGLELVTLQNEGARTQGIVVRVESVHNPGSKSSRRPVVQFVTADGREATFKSKFSFRRSIDTRGDIVAVIYDPKEPGRAMIDRGAWNWAIPGGCVLMGGVGFVTALQRRRAPS